MEQPGSVYEGGFYHGVLRFPKEYPYKPPSILMFTRNGRFKQNVRLCLSMSDYHPESWNPMWSVSSILSGLMSFMLDSQSTLGSIQTTDETRRLYAKQSLQENLKNATFRKLFPQYVALAEQRAHINNDNNDNFGRSRQRDGSITAERGDGDEDQLNDIGGDHNNENDLDAMEDADVPARRPFLGKIALFMGIFFALFAVAITYYFQFRKH